MSSHFTAHMERVAKLVEESLSFDELVFTVSLWDARFLFHLFQQIQLIPNVDAHSHAAKVRDFLRPFVRELRPLIRQAERDAVRDGWEDTAAQTEEMARRLWARGAPLDREMVRAFKGWPLKHFGTTEQAPLRNASSLDLFLQLKAHPKVEAENKLALNLIHHRNRPGDRAFAAFVGRGGARAAYQHLPARQWWQSVNFTARQSAAECAATRTAWHEAHPHCL